MLEQKIEALTQAVLELTTVIKATAYAAASMPAVQKVVKPAAPAPAPAPAPVEAPAEAPVVEANVEAQDGNIKFDDLSKQALAAIKKHGRQQVLDILGRYGVSRVSELDPSEFDEFSGDLSKLGK